MWLLNGKHGQHLQAKNKICKSSQHSLSISGRENWQIASWYSKEFCASVLTPCEHDTKMVLLKKSTRVNYLISSLYKLIVDFINYFFVHDNAWKYFTIIYQKGFEWLRFFLSKQLMQTSQIAIWCSFLIWWLFSLSLNRVKKQIYQTIN